MKADKARKHPFRNGVYSFDELVALRRAKGFDQKSSMVFPASFRKPRSGYPKSILPVLEMRNDKGYGFRIRAIARRRRA